MSRLAAVAAAADPALAPHAVSDPGPGRFEDVDGVRGFVLEAVYEGYLLHYGEGRVLRPADPDLALLAGDRLYALGLARLAELGDLAGVEVLAGVISRAAQAHAEGEPEAAQAAWEAGARAVGHGRGGAPAGG